MLELRIATDKGSRCELVEVALPATERGLGRLNLDDAKPSAGTLGVTTRSSKESQEGDRLQDDEPVVHLFA